MDEEDFRQDHKLKDEAIEGFIKEVNTLKQVKDSQAKNINHIQDAFDLHSQLWIVSDYCSGGSVHTLMKANQPRPRLPEKYIIPIARELALALSHVHDAGVIHRDIKCGNVLISEDGQLQLCDFGVAAIIESDVSKRSTIIGTPYWMAPEMHNDGEPGYGTEIDCWAFGCTVFEMATGMPPYHTFAPSFLRQVLKSVPRLEGSEYSAELCDFVAFCLQAVPEHRPTAKQILAHSYIHGSEDMYPTDSLRELIDHYIQWERKGGQRMSLFNAAGAAAPQMPGEQENDNWIFSTTDQFEKNYAKRHSHAPSITAMDFRSDDFGDLSPAQDLSEKVKLTPFERAEEDSRAKRGERYMERLFQLDAEPYDYDTTTLEESPRRLSDLPLRNIAGDRVANRETLIDLDTSAMHDAPPTFSFEIGDVPTMKAGNRQSEVDSFTSNTQHRREPTRDWKFPTFEEPLDDNTKRATKDWKFPANDTATGVARRTMDWTFNTAGHIADHVVDSEYDLTTPSQERASPAFRPGLQRTATEPLGSMNDFLHPPMGSLDAAKVGARQSTPMIDLDFGDVFRPSIPLEPAAGITRSTTPMSMASMTSVGPFDLEQDSEQNGPDEGHTLHHHRQQKSSVSHIVAQQRVSRSLHERRQLSHSSGLTSRARGNSVDSTASSTADERMWDNKDYNRNMGAKMRDQLRVGLQRTASQSSRATTPRESFDDDQDLYSATYLDTSTTGYDTDGSVRDRLPRTTRPVSAFPDIASPDRTAMAEGASKEVLLAELDRLFVAAEEALGYTSDVFQRREDELGEGTDSESDARVIATTDEEDEYTAF